MPVLSLSEAATPAEKRGGERGLGWGRWLPGQCRSLLDVGLREVEIGEPSFEGSLPKLLDSLVWSR